MTQKQALKIFYLVYTAALNMGGVLSDPNAALIMTVWDGIGCVVHDSGANLRHARACGWFPHLNRITLTLHIQMGRLSPCDIA